MECYELLSFVRHILVYSPSTESKCHEVGVPRRVFTIKPVRIELERIFVSGFIVHHGPDLADKRHLAGSICDRVPDISNYCSALYISVSPQVVFTDMGAHLV